MGGRMAGVVALAGGALIAVAAIGLLADPQEPGRDLHLRLAGGGEVAKGTQARVLEIGDDGAIRERLLWPERLRDGGLGLRLPPAAVTTLTEVALVLDGRTLWQTPPFLHHPEPAQEAEPLTLIAEPAALLPLIGSGLDCGDGPVREVEIARERGSAAITAELDGQPHPLLRDGEGWTAGGIRLVPQAGGLALSGPEGVTALCLPRIPADLRPARISGRGWTLTLHAEAVGWAEAGKPAVLLPTAGTLTEFTGTADRARLDRITFRTGDLGTLRLAAIPAPCAEDGTDRLRAWRIEIETADGRRHLGCAGGPAYPEPGVYVLDGLNGGRLPVAAELVLRGPTFTARSACFAYAGRVLSGEDGVRLAVDRRDPVADCTGSARRLAEELDEALTTGARLSLHGEGRITLRADKPAEGWVQPSTTAINGQRAGAG